MSAKFAEQAGTIDEAVWIALGRAPEDAEKDVLKNYIEKHGMPATARLLFNLNEFSYVD